MLVDDTSILALNLQGSTPYDSGRPRPGSDCCTRHLTTKSKSNLLSEGDPIELFTGPVVRKASAMEPTCSMVRQGKKKYLLYCIQDS